MTNPALNVLLTGEPEVTADNDKVINLIEENLFKLHCLIKANGIHLCTRHEYQGKELLAFTTGKVNLCLYYLFDVSQPPIVKNIPWFLSPNKTISALCFDPSGYWLLVASQDGSLHIVAAASLVDSKRKTNQQKWKEADDIISLSSLNSQSCCSRPSSLIWWQCMATSCQTGIIGTEQGEILFIDLDTGQQIGLTRIDDYISSFQICQDTELDTINLIITSQSKKQWLLVLEQPAKGYIYTQSNGSSAASSEDNENTFTSTIKKWQSKSRLKGLKQLSFDNFSILKKKATKNKHGSSPNSGTISGNNYSQCNGSENYTNPLPASSLAFLTLHYADHGRRLYSRYFSPKSLLTIHENSTSLLPLCAYKLPDNSKDVLLTQHLFYVIDRPSSRLSIISRSLSQDKLNGNSQFNRESIIAQFSFGKRNEVINGLFVANSCDKITQENSFHNNEEIYTIPKIIKDLKIKLVPVNSCIIVTNCGIYRVTLRCSLLSIFMDLIISRAELDKAKRLAKIFGLHIRQLLEYAGDILLANDKFYQATNMFKEAKCRPSKIFAKLASVGCTMELLNCLVHCLEHPSQYKLSIAERMSLSNLSIIAFTELSVRATSPREQTIYKKFTEFLSANLFYDELVAVSIIGQAHLWNILHHLVIKRGLFAQVLDILMKTLPLFFNFKNSHLNTNNDLLVTISEPILIRGMIGNLSIAKSHMSFVLANLSSLQEFVLQRLILLYDPTNPVLRPLMAQCKSQRRSDSRNSLTNSLESIDLQEEMFSLAEKIVEMFLMILLVLIQKTTPVLNHNSDLMKMISLSQIKLYKKDATNLQYKRRFMSCGFSHVTLLRNKIIYNWGSTISGSLGTGPVSGSVYETPQEIIIFRRMGIEVISVSSGHSHTLALTNNGIYAWGGNQYGQVGLDYLSQCPSPQLISSLSDETIVDAVAGQYHSIALTSDGRVFTWGWGVHGQLGHGSIENIFIPTVITSLLGISIKHITAGHAHTMILSSENIVYVFGCNNVGQLGTANTKKYLIPTAVQLLSEKISLIATKYFHNLAVTSSNKLYVWGISPRELQMQKLRASDLESTEKKQNCLSPSSSENVNDDSQLRKNCAKTEDISNLLVEPNDSAQNCTSQKNDRISHSSFCNGDSHKIKDNNKAFVENHFCTSNQKVTKNSEKLTKEEQGKRSKNYKFARSYWMPTLVDTSLVKGKIIQVSTGWNHSALITKDGTVYIWGKNTSGQLGNNNHFDIFRPTPLIYNPVLSFSQVPSKSAGRMSNDEGDSLLKNGTTSNYRGNCLKENFDNDDKDIDNKRLERDEINGDNDEDYVNNVNNNDDDNDSASDNDDDEIRNSSNYHNDFNEKDVDDFENCINSNNSVMKAIEISCGNNYTAAVQQGGAILAWGRIGISTSKPPTLIQMRKRSDKQNCDNVEETSVTLKYLLNTFGSQKNEGVVCISNPSQVPNIPAPVISYQSYDIIPLVGFMPTFDLVEEFPRERILHFTLEQFTGFYDVHKIMKKCIALGNHQACSKLALLEHNFSESLMYQLKSITDLELENEIKEMNDIAESPQKQFNSLDLKDQKNENKTVIEDRDDKEMKKVEKNKFSDFCDKNEENRFIGKSLTLDNINYNSLSLFNDNIQKDLVNSYEESVNKSRIKMPTSKSMDTLSSMENELYTFNCQGGSEEMYGQVEEDNNISEHLTMTNTIDDELASDNSSEKMKMNDFIFDDMDNYPESSGIKKAMNIVEFYINETENFNYTIVREVLLKAINIWLDLRLPLRYLEQVFLQNLDKVFYPLGLILFCKNNLSDDANNDEKDHDKSVTNAINSLSTKLKLNICSTLMRHINQGKTTPEFVELLSQLIAKCFGPPLTGYPGSSENHTMDQMLEGMKSTLSSKQSDPRPFIHIKDPDKVSHLLEMEKDTMVFTCGHYYPISSSEFVPRLETELLVSHLPCTAEVLGRVFQQKGQLETLCPQCIPRALQTVINNSTNR
ncbi:uncharacterized protein LOC122497855 [Leptopilina heterotoma]|uniref:uncharacterized protein LOC122497855 n=1 Tax=Leptopilina heterotoma TaxID=63436 RepID=UPI001CA83DE1|nr:uncharacterized protein LOC122497855 [Leptopilina heterotoma]XP_043461145.1 uncharacterized protein LOC122497855 [Leptopilina heterotoma]